MAYEFFTALRLSRHNLSKNSNKKTISLSLLSIIAVAISLTIMLLSIFIIQGFRKEIHQYVYSQTGHISIYNPSDNCFSTNSHIDINDDLLKFFSNIDVVESVYPMQQKAIILKTKENFEAMLVYGFKPNRLPSYYESKSIYKNLNLEKNDTINPIILPKHIADKMSYKLGDKVLAYFQGENITVRSFTLVDIYNSAAVNTAVALVNISSLQSANLLDSTKYSRLMISFNNKLDKDKAVSRFAEVVSKDALPFMGDRLFAMNTAEELLPSLFDWLNVLDTNVYFLLTLMILVASFSMISALIIIVLDKTQEIALLKAIGYSNVAIRKIFIFLSIRIMLIGMILGNIIAFSLAFLQDKFEIIKLNPETYYMSSVPISFEWFLTLLVNIFTAILILFFIIYPSRIVSKISPSQALKIN